MASVKLQFDSANTTILDPNATLANGARKAVDYNNAAKLDLEATAYLSVMFDTTAPSANTIVAELYLIPHDTVNIPEGGDGSVGSDDTPQKEFLVAAFETINPSLLAAEVLGTLPFRLWEHNRFVLRNTSGQIFSEEWTLTLQPAKRQVV